MEQIAAQQPQCHLVECWLDGPQRVRASPGGVEDEENQDDLNAVNHRALVEIVFEVRCQFEILSQLINKAEECQAIDTVVGFEISVILVLVLVLCDFLFRWC